MRLEGDKPDKMERHTSFSVRQLIANAGKSSFLTLILLFQLVTNIVVLLDIGYLRQIAGLIYLTFVPGFVILKVFRWDRESLAETILFSTGLSIVLVMLLGLLLNELLPVFGLSFPLSTLPLLATLNVVVVLPCLLSYLRRASITVNRSLLSFHTLMLLAIPILSVLGVFAVNNVGNNSLLLLMLVVIAVVVLLGMLFKKILPIKLYSVAILAITVALLFHSSLLTNFIVGWDIHSEYNVFKLTDNAAQWNPALQSFDDRIAKGNSMLSVTILPTVYSKILNLDGTWIFKIVYPLLLSLVPLALYKLYSTRMRKEVAFLSVFFLVSNLAFFGVEGFPAKQMMAEVFYVLLFYVLLAEKMDTFKRNFLTIFFGAGLFASHYSLSYIFIFLVFLTWLFPIVARFFIPNVRRSMKISLSTILLLFTFSFAWYIYTSASAPFDAVKNVGEQVGRNFFLDFFNPLARTRTVLRGLPGLGQASSVGHEFGRIFFYITEIFIVIGIVQMVRRKEARKFGEEYTLLSYFNFGILIMGIVLPNFARYFRMERFYQISLLFLAPFCVMGGETIVNLIMNRLPQIKALRLKALTIVTLVLILFFFFETGFVYEITGDNSVSMPLSMYRMDNVWLSDQALDETDVAGAQWLSQQFNYSKAIVYSDYTAAYHVLTSYGLIAGDNFKVLSNITDFDQSNTYVYLREVNLIEGTMVSLRVYWNFSEISPKLEHENLIYSNGDCEIFRTTEETP